MLPLGLTAVPARRESHRTSATLLPRCLRDRLEELYQLGKCTGQSDVYRFEMLIFSDGCLVRHAQQFMMMMPCAPVILVENCSACIDGTLSRGIG